MTKTKYSKRKKALLSIALSLAPAGMSMLVKGQTIEGGILMGLAAILIVLYDYYDDRAKEIPDVILELDQEVYERIAEVGAEQAKEALDSYHSDQK